MRPLLALLLLLPLAAHAVDPQELAVRAAEVHGTQCQDVAAAKADGAAVALSSVADAWGAVSTAYDASPVPYLLYWRGMLAQCLGQEERALQDLSQFVEANADDASYADSVREAKRRVAALERRLGLRDDAAGRPALVAGAGLGGGAAVFGGLTAWQSVQASTREAAWYSGQLRTDQFDAVEADLRSAERARAGFAATAGTLAVGAAVAIAVGAKQKAAGGSSVRASRAGAQPTFGFALVPTASGVSAAVGGRW